MSEDLTKCPQCGGEADNGIDRCIPPSAYMCSKCCAQEEAERQAALQESEAGAVPFGYLDRQQLERWERLRGTKYAAAEIGRGL